MSRTLVRDSPDRQPSYQDGWSSPLGVQWSAPLSKQVIFSQSAANQPWLVADLGGFVNGEPIFGYTPVNLQEPPTSDPSDLAGAPQTYATFFQQLDSTGTEPKVPSEFIQNPMLQEDIQNTLQDDQQLVGEGFTTTFTHSITAVSPIFAAPTGGVMCGVMNLNEVIKAAPGKPIVQDQDQSQWGTELAPGSYPSVTEDAVFDLCFIGNADGTIALTGSLGGNVSITGG